jgi:gamma-glutamylcyclotransferase (GGCT)/AIG2-like uncharacterized protein YtfP
LNANYFAYGSNLNQADWHRWCRENGFPENLLRPRFDAFVPDRALGFTRMSRARGGGVLDVVPRRGHRVHGVVFEVAEGGWEALARKEGAPVAYRPFDTDALTPDGLAHRVRTFEVAAARERFVAPSAAYLDVVRAGYQAHSIPVAALLSAARDLGSPPGLASVFTYGTLLRGESRAAAFDDDRHAFVPGRVPGRLFDLGEYPGLRPDPSRVAWVHGEIRSPVDAALLGVLDEIEEFPGYDAAGGLYRRRIVDVETLGGGTERAWIYVLGDAGDAPLIAGGDWRAHRARRTAG